MPTTPDPSSTIVHKIQISTPTVLKIVVILLAVLFAWFVREVIGILFAALIVAAALDPWVDSMARRRIPRAVSILGLYIVLLGVFVGLIWIIVPPAVDQTSGLITSLKQYAPQVNTFYQTITQQSDVSLVDQVQDYLSNINQTFSDFTAPVTQTISGIFSAIAIIGIVLVITFYMTVEEDSIKQFVRSMAPLKYQPYLVDKVNRIQFKMGAWLRGQLILMVIIGTLCFIGLAALDIRYALVLAVLAGFLEFVPYLGPILSAIPAVFFAYTDQPWKALAVAIIYLVIQQLENQIIVPKVMQKAVGLNPIIVICAMLVGHLIVPFFGILLAVPATTIAWIFLEDVFKSKSTPEAAPTPVTIK